MIAKLANAAHDCCSVPEPPSATAKTTDELLGQSDRTGQRWSLAANFGAIFSAFIASACCVGPLILALLGLGGGALLVKFEPYRPYFMVVTFALLGTGFWLQYRKPKAVVVEGDACGCPTPRTNRAGKIMLWVATVLVVGFVAFPYLMSFVIS